MNLISATYGWTDDQILDCTIARITQILAAIQLKAWHDDLAERRLRTEQLRTMCTFIAATVRDERQRDVMVTEAQRLSLGAGTELADQQPAAGVGGGPDVVRVKPGNVAEFAGPVGRLNLDDLPDAPPSVRTGQAAPHPDNVGNVVPLHRLGGLLGGGP